jgi:hypothetical protein
MNITRYSVKCTFITPVLGTQPQRDVASDFIASKFVDNAGELPLDEAETLTEMVEKGTTVFHKLQDNPIFYDYQIKGFIKEAGRTFNGLHGVKNLRSKIDSLVFVTPRQIPINVPDGQVIEYLERPLRAETAQGPRVALARSEMLPIGTWFEVHLEVYDGAITEDILRDLFTYGFHKGIGQWRNGGYGRFEFVFS